MSSRRRTAQLTETETVSQKQLSAEVISHRDREVVAPTMACKISHDPEAQESSKVTNRNIRVIAGCLTVFAVCVVAIPIYYKLEAEPPPEPLCEITLSVRLRDFTSFHNGTIADHTDVYPAGYHFKFNGSTMGCLCALRPCIRKCCGRGEYIFTGDEPNEKPNCKKHSDPSAFDNFTLPVYDAKNTSDFANISQDHFRILYGDTCVNGKYMLTPWVSEEDKNYLLDDGRVLVDGDFLDATQYCLEEVQGYDGLQTIVCFPPGEDAETKAMFTFYPIGMILSIPFLLATFLVYAVIPDLRNLHGKSLMCHVVSLLSAYVALCVVQVGTDWVPPSCCFSIGKINMDFLTILLNSTRQHFYYAI